MCSILNKLKLIIIDFKNRLEEDMDNFLELINELNKLNDVLTNEIKQINDNGISELIIDIKASTHLLNSVDFFRNLLQNSVDDLISNNIKIIDNMLIQILANEKLKTLKLDTTEFLYVHPPIPGIVNPIEFDIDNRVAIEYNKQLNIKLGNVE